MDDKDFLKLAIEEAKKSKDSDMYWVGAVIVKNGKILSRAYSDETKEKGHAEELAIKRSKKDISGATIYTTMEPCGFGPSNRTSCSNLIISSGIKRVVYGVKDPEVKIPCNGIEKLKEAGIEVFHLKELEKSCREITPSLFR